MGSPRPIPGLMNCYDYSQDSAYINIHGCTFIIAKEYKGKSAKEKMHGAQSPESSPRGVTQDMFKFSPRVMALHVKYCLPEKLLTDSVPRVFIGSWSFSDGCVPKSPAQRRKSDVQHKSQDMGSSGTYQLGWQEPWIRLGFVHQEHAGLCRIANINRGSISWPNTLMYSGLLC